MAFSNSGGAETTSATRPKMPRSRRVALAGAGHEAAHAAAVALVVAQHLEQRLEAGALVRQLLAQRDELGLVLDELGAGPLQQLLLGAALLLEPELELPGLAQLLDVVRSASRRGRRCGSASSLDLAAGRGRGGPGGRCAAARSGRAGSGGRPPRPSAAGGLGAGRRRPRA